MSEDTDIRNSELGQALGLLWDEVIYGKKIYYCHACGNPIPKGRVALWNDGWEERTVIHKKRGECGNKSAWSRFHKSKVEYDRLVKRAKAEKEDEIDE